MEKMFFSWIPYKKRRPRRKFLGNEVTQIEKTAAFGGHAEPPARGVCAVSYTHLDVYKRQVLNRENKAAAHPVTRRRFWDACAYDAVPCCFCLEECVFGYVQIGKKMIK